MLKAIWMYLVSMEVEVESVDIALNAQLKAFERIQDLRKETFLSFLS